MPTWSGCCSATNPPTRLRRDLSYNLRNQARTQDLLGLMVLQLGHRADQDRYFRIVKEAPKAGNFIDFQAQRDDPKALRSLWA